MTEQDSKQQDYSEHDYCPICGLLAVGEEKHICPEEVLDEICREEEARSEMYDDDDDKLYGERLDDAEFILNYYDEDYDDDNEEF